MQPSVSTVACVCNTAQLGACWTACSRLHRVVLITAALPAAMLFRAGQGHQLNLGASACGVQVLLVAH